MKSQAIVEVQLRTVRELSLTAKRKEMVDLDRIERILLWVLDEHGGDAPARIARGLVTVKPHADPAQAEQAPS